MDLKVKGQTEVNKLKDDEMFKPNTQKPIFEVTIWVYQISSILHWHGYGIQYDYKKLRYKYINKIISFVV